MMKFFTFPLFKYTSESPLLECSHAWSNYILLLALWIVRVLCICSYRNLTQKKAELLKMAALQDELSPPADKPPLGDPVMCTQAGWPQVPVSCPRHREPYPGLTQNQHLLLVPRSRKIPVMTPFAASSFSRWGSNEWGLDLFSIKVFKSNGQNPLCMLNPWHFFAHIWEIIVLNHNLMPLFFTTFLV